MKIILILSLFLLSTQVSSQDKSNDRFYPKYNTPLSQDQGVKMMMQCSRSTPHNINGFFDISDSEILLVNNHLCDIQTLKSTEGGIIGGKIERLEDYGYQYIGVNISNRRYIYINAFFIDIAYEQDSFKTWYKEWKTQPIIVCDGGNGFWGILFDIENHTFSQFAINGVG